MAFSSDIQLPLAQEPKTADMGVWPDFIDVYNSIHILSQLVDRLRNGSGDANTPPWEAMPFTRYFYSEAAEEISAGSVISIVNLSRGVFQPPDHDNWVGVVRGAPAYAGLSFSARGNSGFASASNGAGLVGIALNDCVRGELCQVGVGPAIMKVEGTEPGDTIMAATFLDTTAQQQFPGVLVINNDDYRGNMSNTFISFNSVVVGYGVAKDAVMIMPFMDYMADLQARKSFETPYNSEPQN